MEANLALEVLNNGNKRYVNDCPAKKNLSINRRYYLAEEGQNPIAVIITCADSRVVPEYIFDTGIGDLFVIRTPGSVVDEIVMGSIEYAVECLKVQLIMVMGHEKCNMIKMVVDKVPPISENNSAIYTMIEPAIIKANKKYIPTNFYEAVTDIHIRNMSQKIKDNHLIKKMLEDKIVKVVAAKYFITSGQVNVI